MKQWLLSSSTLLPPSYILWVFQKKNYALNLSVKVFSTKYLVNWEYYFNVSFWRWDTAILLGHPSNMKVQPFAKAITFMFSIDRVLKIECLDLRPVISSRALWTGLVLLQFAPFPFLFKLLIILTLLLTEYS